jgi:hypothetical protein
MENSFREKSDKQKENEALVMRKSRLRNLFKKIGRSLMTKKGIAIFKEKVSLKCLEI